MKSPCLYVCRPPGADNLHVKQRCATAPRPRPGRPDRGRAVLPHRPDPRPVHRLPQPAPTPGQRRWSGTQSAYDGRCTQFAVLAGDAGALTGFTVALCNKLRRMNTEPQRLPLITIVAGVRRARRDLASEQGHASPPTSSCPPGMCSSTSSGKPPASFRHGNFGRPRWPDVWLAAHRPCQTLTGFL